MYLKVGFTQIITPNKNRTWDFDVQCLDRLVNPNVATMRVKKRSNRKNTCKCVFKLLRLIGNIALWSVFLFWGLEAIEKFMSRPTSSSVAFTNGDDDDGNFAMPAVTICLNEHRDWMKFITRQVDKCVDLSSTGGGAFSQSSLFYKHLIDCLVSKTHSTTSPRSTSTTTEYDIFGGWFGTEEPVISRFDNLNEYIDVIQLEIEDILYSFAFDTMDLKKVPSTDRVRFLKSYWVHTYHMKHGQCFTFDPVLNNFNLTNVPEMSIDFKFNLFQNDSNFSPPIFSTIIHDSFEDRFDAFVRNPKVLITKNKIFELKLSKTVMQSLNGDTKKCFEEQYYGFEKCVHLKSTGEFIKRYNCTLPWMMNLYEFRNYTYCDSNSEDISELVGLIKEALEFNNIAENECKKYLPCTRSIYEDLLVQKPDVQTEEYSRSSLTISFSSPYIQVIKDSWSYNLQSFIGEVGGTLGLLLGFSFSSLFDLFEYFLNKL